jgi:hypothetical protein
MEPKLPHGFTIDALIEEVEADSNLVKNSYVMSHKNEFWRIDLMDNTYEDLLYLCEQDFTQDDMRCLTKIYSGTGTPTHQTIIDNFNIRGL